MKKTKISSRTFLLTAVIGSLLIVAMVVGFTLWSAQRTSMATDEAVSKVSSFYLKAMADRRAKIITNLISNSFDEMEKAVAFISDEKAGSQEELRNGIGKIESLLGLNRFALVDMENTVYTQYTTYSGGSRHTFLSEEVLQDRIISTISLYGSSKQLCLAIPTPDLSLMGKAFKACFIRFDIRDIVDLLALDDEGGTHFALYSMSGGNLSGTELGPVISKGSFFDAVRGLVPEKELEEHQRNFENRAEGNLSFVHDDTQETLYYVPVPGTDWEMTVLIRESVIQDQIRDISERNLMTSRNLVLFTLASALILAIVLLFQIRSLSRAKLEAEKETSNAFRHLANTDSMTGVRNKHAYSEKENEINRQIEAGDRPKLGIVVCDINRLKEVNDTRGHAAGDQLIQEACAMICEHFKRGAVYRIGGDEFAVVLEGAGYDTMQEAVAELNRRVEENLRTNAVVVSIGSAELEPGDRQLQDAFKRADQMMYQRKKELKSKNKG